MCAEQGDSNLYETGALTCVTLLRKGGVILSAAASRHEGQLHILQPAKHVLTVMARGLPAPSCDSSYAQIWRAWCPPEVCRRLWCWQGCFCILGGRSMVDKWANMLPQETRPAWGGELDTYGLCCADA